MIFFLKNKNVKNAAIFMSGTGTNAEKILEHHSNVEIEKWTPSVIVTDAPEKSRAREIAAKYKIPLLESDILQFYRERGESRVSIKTDAGRRIREEWTNHLRRLLDPYEIDFGILAGFVPLTNITSDFPCLNVHPGDLTVEDENGRRLLSGLHTIPIETAILLNHDSMRSSVIVAQPYTGHGGEMDSGPILGISEPVKIELGGCTRTQLSDVFKRRPASRPPGGYRDELENIAQANLSKLKENGDWVIFPRVVEDFASNRFAMAPDGKLLYGQNNSFQAVKTRIYAKNNEKSYCI